MTLTTHTIAEYGYGGKIVAVYDDVTLAISEFRYRSPSKSLRLRIKDNTEETLSPKQDETSLRKTGHFMTKTVLTDEREGRTVTEIGFDGEIKMGWNR